MRTDAARASGIFLSLLLACLCVCLSPAPALAGGREVLSLDGPWQFRMDPDGKGGAENWHDRKVAFPSSIQVPGSWGGQGFGAPADKVRHHYEGQAWYRRHVEIPRAWEGKRIFLTLGGVHRSAKTYVNGILLGEHIGYLSKFAHDLTPHVRPGGKATIAICVDSRQHWDVDPLTGAMDVIDAMFVPWGGLSGHVALEARGRAWLEDLFVRTRVAPPACTATAVLAGAAVGEASLRLEILDSEGTPLADVTAKRKTPLAPGASISLSAKAPGAKLWSPAAPALHTARLTLRKGGRVLDQVCTRVGFREIRVDGPHVLLNGRRIFLHGYGDDSIYPETISPPTDKQAYLRRLRVAKAYGFNHVRHHSHFLPDEYYDACDEAGILVTPELPIAYMSYFRRAKGKALDLYKTEWVAAIKRHRNHPSILDWCMGNEFWHGLPIAPELYRLAKALDPARPVVDSDGLFAGEILAGKSDRATLDLWFTMFDIHNLPLDRPDKHKFPRPKKPVISHETGNYGTLPRLDQIERFRHNTKPFWLTPVRAKLQKLGLLSEAELWSANSEKLYLLCHKLNIEDLRKNPYASGHHWWLLQDYWTGSNGIVDTYFRPKAGVAADAVRQFNADVVILQDGLPMTCRAGETLAVDLRISNFSPAPLVGGAFKYSWRADGAPPRESGRPVSVSVGQGEVKSVCRAKLPGAALAGTTAPTRWTLAAELTAGNVKQTNAWTTCVYPARIGPPKTAVPLFAGPVILPALAGWGAKPIPRGALPARAVYVMRQPTPRVLDAVEKGAALVLLDPVGLLPTARTRFKTSWWLGNARDCNVGTVVYANPVTHGMAPDGWCDASWYRLLEGATTFVLDDLGPADQGPEVLVRALDIHPLCRGKALLFQAGVGKGALLVSGVRLFLYGKDRPPEARWLLKRLLEHAASLPGPKARFPLQRLRQCAVQTAPPPGPCVLGFDRLVSASEEGVWHSFREDDTKFHICRQTRPGNAVTWRTAPAPAAPGAGEPVTFVFAGGLGWVSQPKTPGLTLRVDGKDVLTFDVTQAPAVWKSPDGKVRLAFHPLRQLPLDAVGLFYLTLPANRTSPGKPVVLGVVSRGKASQRWFGLNPYNDLLGK